MAYIATNTSNWKRYQLHIKTILKPPRFSSRSEIHRDVRGQIGHEDVPTPGQAIHLIHELAHASQAHLLMRTPPSENDQMVR